MTNQLIKFTKQISGLQPYSLKVDKNFQWKKKSLQATVPYKTKQQTLQGSFMVDMDFWGELRLTSWQHYPVPLFKL